MADKQLLYGQYVDYLVGRLAYETGQLFLLREAIKVCPPERFQGLMNQINHRVAHSAILEQTIRRNGGDPLVETRPARVCEHEYQGVLWRLKPRDYATLVQAIFEFAGRSEHVHWESLIYLARKLNETEAREAFEVALGEERIMIQELSAPDTSRRAA